MRSSGLTAALLVLAGRLAAQSDCSSVPLVYRRSCDQAVDAYKTLQPLAGVAISGGGPELGTAHTLGGLGHVFVSARVNAVKATVPNPDTTRAAISGTLPAPIIEGGIGAGSVPEIAARVDRKSTRLNSSHVRTSYAVFCLNKKNAT